jgi:hypothetical protein
MNVKLKTKDKEKEEDIAENEKEFVVVDVW